MNKMRFLFIGIVTLLLFGITSCTQEAETLPQAWIDYPADGAFFSAGTPIQILSHVYARNGVAEVVLSINGEGYRRDTPPEDGQTLTGVQQDWVPSEAGDYTLQVRAYDHEGRAGNPAVITVHIQATEDQPTPIPTSPPTALPPSPTLLPPTPTSLPTLTPLPPTFTALPPTPTSPPPTEIPADTSPPPAPTPVVPADGLIVSCRATQNLAWMPVSDPSGIAGYDLRLEREFTIGNWQVVAEYNALADKQVTVDVLCGFHYRWRVRAKDGAGNLSAWSAYSSFALELE
jgi:hypothetical protein